MGAYTHGRTHDGPHGHVQCVAATKCEVVLIQEHRVGIMDDLEVRHQLYKAGWVSVWVPALQGKG